SSSKSTCARWRTAPWGRPVTRIMCSPSSLDALSKKALPRSELPNSSSGGENDASDSCPGMTPRMPPATPDLAGMPTLFIQLPAALYMPDVDMTDSTHWEVSSLKTRSPLSGFTPPLARVAPMVARSQTLMLMEHCQL